MQVGATGVLQDVWDPARFVELVAEHGITYTSAATPFLHDTLNAPDLGAHDVSTLERFCCMGAPIPRAIVREARRKLPGLVVLGGWGQSENGLVTLSIPGDPDDKLIDTDGYPWPGMRIRVVDAEGREPAQGQEGRLQVTGPFLFVGYAERPEMTRASFDGEWFDTGDLARIDAEGYLSISGRTKDVIMRGGENIPVAYVENVLYENPTLAGVALVAVPDPRLQERACACVVLAPGAGEFTFTEMQEFLAAKGVSKHYWPERLVVLPELPRTASGKIQKFQLRERLATMLDWTFSRALSRGFRGTPRMRLSDSSLARCCGICCEPQHCSSSSVKGISMPRTTLDVPAAVSPRPGTPASLGSTAGRLKPRGGGFRRHRRRR